MPDVLAQVLAMPGLGWIIATAAIAGCVYGFAGFGAALIFMPIAVRMVPVELAIAAFNVSALASLVTVVPKAWKQVNRRAMYMMIAAAVVTTPFGLWVLKTADVVVLRWAVVGVVAATLVALVSGWRYAAQPTTRTRVAVASTAGFVGGSTGLMGPVMILFQLGGQDSPAVSRATTAVFLTVSSVFLLPLMALQGLMTPTALILGAFLLVPYGLGTRIGRMLFQPENEALYRYGAYVLIAGAVVAGMPVWG